jgi:hypothetical protein
MIFIKMPYIINPIDKKINQAILSKICFILFLFNLISCHKNINHLVQISPSTTSNIFKNQKSTTLVKYTYVINPNIHARIGGDVLLLGDKNQDQFILLETGIEFHKIIQQFHYYGAILFAHQKTWNNDLETANKIQRLSPAVGVQYYFNPMFFLSSEIRLDFSQKSYINPYETEKFFQMNLSSLGSLYLGFAF